MSESKIDVGPTLNYKVCPAIDMGYIELLKFLQQIGVRVYKMNPSTHEVWCMMNQKQMAMVDANEIECSYDLQFGPKETCYVP